MLYRKVGMCVHVFALPVLQVDTLGVNCLLMVNGAIIGETTGLPLVPLSPDGLFYLSLFPLDGAADAAAFPLTLRISIKGNQLQGPLPTGTTAHCHGNGLMRLFISLPLFPLDAQTALPYSISKQALNIGGQRLSGTLFSENGMRFAVEDIATGDLIALSLLEDVVDGRVTTGRVLGGEPAFLLTGEGVLGERYLVFSQRDGFSPTIDEYGQGAVDGDTVQCLTPVGDLLGHQCRTVFTREGDALSREETYGYFTTTPRELTAVQQCMALVQCLKLGLVKEAYDMLSPSLQADVSMEDLAGFFGDFHDLYPDVKNQGKEIVLPLSYPLFPQCYRLQYYGFSLTDAGIDNIQALD
ncbi:hypothetical protein LJC20_06045 [Eubacteriales bacterium OttesenSCG-928-M02]|nr:hypothetical protein [Eubacteriales bacterium OttesenSCG-928-M02]